MSGPTVLGWCLRHFMTLDQSNAAVHCAPVKYSPITFVIAEAIDANPIDHNSDDLADSREVLAHRGRYELDKGR